MAVATESPEPADPTEPVPAVGIGPGNPSYLTPRGRTAIEAADAVVGFASVVEFVAELVDSEQFTCGYRDEAETLAAFADRLAEGATGAAVLMGDPNHSGYQFLGKLEAAIDRPVEVIPGISSLQIAASRARTPMEATTFVTLHKSGPIEAELARLRAAAGRRNLLVLPRPYDWMPEDIACDLVEHGCDPARESLVFERLTHPDEQVTRGPLGELAGRGGDDSAFSDLSVLAVRTP